MRNDEIQRLIELRGASLLGRLLDGAPVGASLALDSKIAYANHACANMFGFADPAQMLDLPFFALIDPSMHAFVVRLWHSRPEGCDEPFTYELRGVRRDGSVFPYRCTSLGLEVPGAKATFAYFEDLSTCGAARAEEQLAEEHERFLARLLESLHPLDRSDSAMRLGDGPSPLP